MKTTNPFLSDSTQLFQIEARTRQSVCSATHKFTQILPKPFFRDPTVLRFLSAFVKYSHHNIFSISFIECHKFEIDVQKFDTRSILNGIILIFHKLFFEPRSNSIMATCGQQEFEIGTLNHFKIHSENLFERVSCDQLADKMFRRYGKDWFSDWL